MSTPVYSARGARALDAAIVAKAQAEADAVRAHAAAEAARAQAEIDRVRRQADAEARETARQERAARAVRRRAARTRLAASAASRRELLVTVAVIVLFVSVALPAQVGFLATRWPLLMAVAGGVSLESLTWMFAIQGEYRERRGLSARWHHTGTWIAGALAASINLAHGAHLWGLGFAVVAAVGSLAAPVAWFAYRLSQSEQDGDRTPEEIRAERARRRHHRKVYRVAVRLRTATMPPLPEEQAWRAAWQLVHGADPGITGAALKRRAARARRVLQVAGKHDPGVVMPSLADLCPAPPTNGAGPMTGEVTTTPPQQDTTIPRRQVVIPSLDTLPTMPVRWDQLAPRTVPVRTTSVTTVAAARSAPRMVTEVVTQTPVDLRKTARRLNRNAVKTTGRPVTIQRLRDELNLSRREAAALRRDIVRDDRSTTTSPHPAAPDHDMTTTGSESDTTT
ncbi:hypothetical protein AQ490_06480 [Wenjunlia vitaminophila]|uniref:DUF2637 domain-containing protein n=1 Tax=Wenjunlia vitaminophila TaxID=76728 RepID=A0A0T6LNS5_WENVI|nr:hypothetical protein [Wenjunlia vitaminophila]KRV47538.1 hypothetical protein AQ490_06480 [Wenjunlia vitaminophila]